MSEMWSWNGWRAGMPYDMPELWGPLGLFRQGKFLVDSSQQYAYYPYRYDKSFCLLTNAWTPSFCLTFLHVSQYFLRFVLEPRSIGLPQETQDANAHKLIKYSKQYEYAYNMCS